MSAMTFMVQQLDARPAPVPRTAPRDGSRAEGIRVLLEELGPQRARDIAARLDLPSGRVSALLKRDLQIGRVRFREGLYHLVADWDAKGRPMLAPGQELITWHEVDKEMPDADLTVLVRTEHCAEPVWLGYFDGEVWRDTGGEGITVVRWADMPEGGAP